MQFKQTKDGKLLRHFNIDSGYKYLNIDSLKHSDRELTIYYDPNDEGKGYLRYLNKLNQYLESPILDEHEHAILGEFCSVLSRQALDWLDGKWNLCPLLLNQFGSPRKYLNDVLGKRTFSREDSSLAGGQICYLRLNFKTTPLAAWEGGARANISVPDEEWNYRWISENEIEIELDDNTTRIDLSKLTVLRNPIYEYSQDLNCEYALAGFSLSSAANISRLDYGLSSVLTQSNFLPNSNTLTLYSAWSSDYVLEFASDDSDNVTGEMPSVVLRMGQ